MQSETTKATNLYKTLNIERSIFIQQAELEMELFVINVYDCLKFGASLMYQITIFH